MKAVLFDLDGTLLDTLEDIANACNTALGRHGFPPHPAAAYRFFVGDGVPTLISRVVPRGNHDVETLAKVAAAYREEYQRNWNVTTRPYDGIPELLEQLAHRGIALAVLSNKPDDFTRRCVDEFLPTGRFSIVQGACQAYPPKPDPAAALHIAAEVKLPAKEFAYLGDTDTDMKTAVAAGMFPVGVEWGFRTAKELTKSGARLLLQSPGDLLNHL